jgi:putative phosphoesterase
MNSTKIGVISDTHNHLNTKVLHYFQGVDLIFHAGDIGSEDILFQLERIASIRAVRGNTDYQGSVSKLPEKLIIPIGKLNFLVIHDIGNINSFQERLKQNKIQPSPGVIIFGHTHQAFYKKLDNAIFINPGSATDSRDYRKPSIMILETNGLEITTNRIIEL